ncbi:hypothetical protein [Epilithonimonas sp. UC225_85]|uniref:hypothetical protein n=1 Tax=Epilithonimonas sp. UC225_85 TaxID=3350167 RepID=UPI0036D257A5
MKKEIFIKLKETLRTLLESVLELNGNHGKSILKLLDILNQYDFNNRLYKKGALTRYIIDSATVDLYWRRDC